MQAEYLYLSLCLLVVLKVLLSIQELCMIYFQRKRRYFTHSIPIFDYSSNFLSLLSLSRLLPLPITTYCLTHQQYVAPCFYSSWRGGHSVSQQLVATGTIPEKGTCIVDLLYLCSFRNLYPSLSVPIAFYILYMHLVHFFLCVWLGVLLCPLILTH